MRRGLFPALILLLCAFAEARPSGLQDSATFSVSVNLIKVPITVFDTHGATVQDLRREDFILYEDQAKQQIRSFGVDRQPVSVVLLLDNSATVEKELSHMKESAESFADALSHDDRVSVITFGDEVILQQDWTTETRQVRKSLRRIKSGLRTALYDGMYSAAH
jgi:VWFA-related protein